MMNEKQLKRRIWELERELAIFKEILETQSDNSTGRPRGSTRYTAEMLLFLEKCEREGISDKDIIKKFNEKFKTTVPANSRQLYNIMQRKGIRKTGWRYSDWRRFEERLDETKNKQ